MLLALNNMLSNKVLMKNCNSVQNLIWTEFIDAKLEIRDKVLANAKSAVHISCDLWSSPNGFALCGIAGYFVDVHYKIRSVLLGLRWMHEAHTGEQIGRKIIGVIEEYGIQQKLGVFIGDNVDSNDIAWREVLSQLHPDRDPAASRSRCLGHIINLAAKAFIFGDNVEAFERGPTG
jgi:hypothetical protein